MSGRIEVLDRMAPLDKPKLDYAPPEPQEPLGRWFVRRALWFLLGLAAWIAFVRVAGFFLFRSGAFDFMAQD